MVEPKDIAAAASAASITVVVGYSLYKYLKERKPPGVVPAILIPSLTAFFFVSTAPPAEVV